MDLFFWFAPDHYRALGIPPDASNADIERAYGAALSEGTGGRGARVRAWLCGRSPRQLAHARAELLDPARRRAHDEQLEALRIRFSNPPQ